MQTLVIGEVALASVLLLAAGLMAHNLSRLDAADLGLSPSGWPQSRSRCRRLATLTANHD